MSASRGITVPSMSARPWLRKLPRAYDPGNDRKRLDTLLSEFSRIVECFCAHDPVLRGSLLTIRRSCGKPTCHCAQGKPHESSVFVDKSSGKRSLFTVTRSETRWLRRPSRHYRTLVRLRGRLTKLLAEALLCCDRLCAFRMAAGRRFLLKRRHQ